MNAETLRAYCLDRPGVTEGFPFGEGVLVFKVMGKIFALLSLDAFPLSVNLKCDPERAVELRERYEAVQPGYHMNKTHWNTVVCDGTVPDAVLREMIDHSYDVVARGLKKADREALAALRAEIRSTNIEILNKHEDLSRPSGIQNPNVRDENV